MAEIDVFLPDGSARSLPAGATGRDLAASLGPRLAKDAVAAAVDGDEVDLGAPLPDGAKVSIVTADSDEGRHVLRHSTAHVLAQAVTRLFPGAKYTIGPAIENGFYYDFDVPGGRTFTDDDLAAIDAEMREIIAEDQPFVRSELPRRRRARSLRRPAVQARDHRAGRRRPGRRLRRGRGGRRRRRQPLPELAGVRRPLPRAARAVDGPPRPLQAAEGGGRLLAGRREAPDAPARSTARRGRATRRSRSTCTGWRRPRSATTASWPSSSTCSASPRSWAAASPCGTRRAPSCAS